VPGILDKSTDILTKFLPVVLSLKYLPSLVLSVLKTALVLKSPSSISLHLKQLEPN
jgi:hypothetical protein